jgi:Gluconate 2-dehydrogenase subunit 3
MTKRRPKVLDGHQMALVGVICDLIIPETASPGALSVGAPEYIGFTLTRASIHARQRFLDGLEWIDRESKRCFGRTFICLATDQQIALLRRVDVESSNEDQDSIGAAFFRDIKNRTVYAYYTSKAGIFQELGYKGNTPLTDFPGCEHPKHLRLE